MSTKPADATLAPPADPAQSVTPAPAPFTPRWFHQRLYLAYELAFMEGQVPTDTVIAKAMGCRRETVCRFRARHPEVMFWIYERLGDGALTLRGAVDRRTAQLAMQGSVDHAKLYYQFVARIGTPFGLGREFGESDPGVNPAVLIQPQQVYLVPRPEYPKLPEPVKHAAPTQLTDIPTVAVR